jgi:hypothetical protein
MIHLVMLAALQGQINIQIDDSKDRGIPAVRRTDPRDEPALVKIVEQRGPGAMSALFSLGYLRDPAPRTLEVLRDAASSEESLVAYPAICSLWRIDDPQWRSRALTALPRLTHSQRFHLADLLFRSGDFSAWPLLRESLLDLLAIPGSEEKLKFDVYSMIAAAWEMKPKELGEPLRDLRRLLSKRGSSVERERSGKLLDEFDFQKHSAGQNPSNIQ